jgi:predicted metal-dependent HD superfamily phosphohydrolase
MTMELRERWLELCRELGARGDDLRVWNDLAARYGEAHRAYHDLRHLEQCFAEFDRVRATLRDPTSVALAIFFHDAIYDTHAPGDNEAKSADLCDEACGALRIDEWATARARALILATKDHAGLDGDADGEIFLDIDMSILGQPRIAFERYERDVRTEYAWVPDEIFAAKRGAFLRGVLARPHVFASAAMRERYEATARANTEQSLAALSSRR